MSEQALLTLWEAFVNELGSITNDLSNAIHANSLPKIIGEYNRFPKVFNEKLLSDFEHIVNKIKEEKRIDFEITKKARQLEHSMNASSFETGCLTNFVYDVSDARELVERLAKDLTQEKNKNNKISHLQTQINTNRIKSKSILNTDSRDALVKQIKKDEESLDIMLHNQDIVAKAQSEEIAILKSKIDTVSNQKDVLANALEELEAVNKTLEINANTSAAETERLNAHMSSLASEQENNKTGNDELVSKYERARKDIDDLKVTHVHNTKIIDNFDMQNLTRYKESVSQKLTLVKLTKAIQNINQLLISKKTFDAKRMCAKTVASEFVPLSEVDDIVSELHTMIDSFKDLKDTVVSYNEKLAIQLDCVYK
jgi:chromosome segregation ATPase